jgi:hypothetical protein
MARDVQMSRRMSRFDSAAIRFNVDRRAISFSLLALLGGARKSIAVGPEISAGCVFYEASDSPELRSKGPAQFPDLRRIGERNSDNGLAAVLLELYLVFGVNAVVGLYNDLSSGPDGNAGAIQGYPFEPLGTGPNPEGFVALGDKCLSRLRETSNQSAAIAAICAHEVGHLLQTKHVSSELYRLRIEDRGVVRTELHPTSFAGITRR